MGRLYKRLSVKINILMLGAILSLFSSSIQGKEPDWYLKLKKIKVLQSTKQDIQKLFPTFSVKKAQTFSRNEQIFYESNREELLVFYSTGKCPTGFNEKGYSGYNVEKDIVIGVIYHPAKYIKISKLKLDLSNFESYKETDTDNYVYFNFDLGIRYGIHKMKVHTIEFFASNSAENLRCEKVKLE